MDKTVVVDVERRVVDSRYHKTKRQNKRFKVWPHVSHYKKGSCLGIPPFNLICKTLCYLSGSSAHVCLHSLRQVYGAHFCVIEGGTCAITSKEYCTSDVLNETYALFVLKQANSCDPK